MTADDAPRPAGIVVAKLGGSLLDWPELPTRLSTFLADHAERRLVLIVGGGGAVDVVRALDRIHGLGEERSHHLAMRALDLTAHALATLMAGSERRLVVVEAMEDLEPSWRAGRTPILAPRRFLDSDDQLQDRLPHTWQVTSDTIAARLAARLGAGELVLLKSAPPPRSTDRVAAARLGLVDPEFPRAAALIPRVTYLNFRDPAAHPARTELA